MSLHPDHREQLHSSAIADDIIEQRGYETVVDRLRLRQLGFSDYQARVPGILVPLFDVRGENGNYTFRPDRPRERKNRRGQPKPIKYEFRRQASPTLDIHPSCSARLGDPSVDLWIAEGVKKCDAGLSARAERLQCAVALQGVYNWRGTNKDGGIVGLPDWEYVALNGRTIFLAFDNDEEPKTKVNVHKARARLARLLQLRKANVYLIDIPARAGSKGVLDD
jgi:hypothetical protein